jgi:hypothetical protein
MSLTFPYLSVPLPAGPSNNPGGSTSYDRPIIAIRLGHPGTGQSKVIDEAVLDTGAADTIFPISDALALNIPLLPLTVAAARLRWRGSAHALRFGTVDLFMDDGREFWTWTALVGFSIAPLPYPILGHHGVLEYMNALFKGADREVVLDPAANFPGTIS